MVNLNYKFYPLTKKKQGKTVLLELDNKAKRLLTHTKKIELEKRLSNTYVPKHLHNIYIAKSPNNKVQIIGQDDDNRYQYFYNKAYSNKSESRKYKSLSNLGNVILKLENDNFNNIKKLYNTLKQQSNYTLNKSDALELVLYFLLYHHIRIGSKQYLDKYGSTGISTLKCKHFKFINNTTCHIKFIGKKNIENNSYIQHMGNDNLNNIKTILLKNNTNNNTNTTNNNTNNTNNTNNINNNMNVKLSAPAIDIHRYVLNIIKMLKKNKSDNDFIFDYNYKNTITDTDGTSLVSTSDFKDYYKDKYNVEITPKMFRTWFANYYVIYYINIIADMLLSELKVINSKSELNKLKSIHKNKLLTYASNNLNNTVAICKKKYINNQFLDTLFNNKNNFNLQINKINKSINNNSYNTTRTNIHKYIIKHLL
jgi:DNA topoisomerase IB